MQPESFAVHPAAETEAGPICSICQTAIALAEPIGPCPSCASTFHEECWKENGGCAVYGCPSMPKTVKEANPSIAPQTYWGQEQKDCPSCGQKIKVGAVRCRFCGASFETAVPITRREHAEKQRQAPERESLKKMTITVFICGVVPVLAPLGFLFGGIWFLRHRKEIGKLPATNRVLCYVGLIAAVLCTTLIALVFLLN